MRTALSLLLGVAVVSGLPRQPSRIVGGTYTTIEEYPFAVSMQFSSSGVAYTHFCGASIINQRSVLSAVHCYMDDNEPFQWIIRAGSSFTNTGGTVYNTDQIILHPEFIRATLDKDVAIIRIVGTFTFSSTVQPANIPRPFYPIRDDAPVHYVGWGALCHEHCEGPEQVKHVQVWIVNHDICKERYAQKNMMVNGNMLCSGMLGVGGRDACQGDSGGPLVHNGNFVIGVTSWGYSCADPNYPGITARVPLFYNWIMSNA